MNETAPSAWDQVPVARMHEPLAAVLGARSAGPLAKMGLQTVEDLVRHYPRRYGEPGRMTDMTGLVVGEHVTVLAQVVTATVRHMRSRGGAMLQAVVTDGTQRLGLTFFAKRPGALRVHEDKLRPGRTGLFTGVVSEYRGERQLTHPDYLVVGVDADDEAAALVEAGRPIPIYPASAAAPTWRIERCVRTVLGPLTPDDVPDPIPGAVRERRNLVGLHQALVDVHEPQDDAQWQRGRDRLRYEEAFVLQVALARRRSQAAHLEAVARPLLPPAGPGDSGGGGGASVLQDFDARLPFDLTAGQRTVGEEISGELARDRPMQRLLQGEVGSGKTVVALRAMLQVVDAGGQAALLAPTEVLAGQHARTLRTLLGDLADGGLLGGAEHGTRVALLTGSQGAADRKRNLLDAASGAAGIVVGTHALLGENVQFADLGLVVVDEQHRFGVEQRDALRTKAARAPHLLVMTATPIPRTVAMTVFGDLEISTLREIPAGRSGITTHVVPAGNAAWTARTWARVREEISAGRSAYVVCPRISAADDAPGDGLDLGGLDGAAPPDGEPERRPLRAVLEVADELRGLPVLDGVRIGILHGQMAAPEKEAAMAAFTAGDIDLLVSTTVVEVGVDVPRATAMVILDADRFGISQLHQLRGRVGRGSEPGICLLVTEASPDSPAGSRLATVAGSTDGFELAAADLEMRSEGDVLGSAQSGRASSLRLLRVVRDADVIADARADADEVVAEDAELSPWPALRAAIAERLSGEREEFLDRA
ncbi:ATP-dependent DNA helicase RecG [Sanguibacter sp. 25GB23B1]|uniref:ATP-dependent DNA helicase RecG n=1 Tax=unclassified Sanguibacter TaxID=2645534 RepID=UPI0032AF66DB